MNIRNAIFSDKDDVFSLLNELRRSGYAEMGEPFTETPITEKAIKQFTTLLGKDDVHILVTEDNGDIIGLSVAYEIPKILDGNKRLLIEEMVVKPGFRRKGVGSQLLEKLESIAKEKGIMYVKVTTGTKLKANQFYQKHGFKLFENAYRKKVF
jgi:GNAT superfamily N-acetyltransferase